MLFFQLFTHRFAGRTDKHDNSSLGEVIFMPFLMSPVQNAGSDE
jgi:hypothetical protein